MNTDPKKWSPFNFLRSTGSKPDGNSAESGPSGEQWHAAWPDIPRLFSRDSWRAMEAFFHDPFAGRAAIDRRFGDFSAPRFQPRIDVVDDGQVLRVTAELPGMERKDLRISVEGGAIVLRGEKKQDVRGAEDGCYRLERAYGRFTRTIPMPDNVDAGRALAKLENGVLTLTVPKLEPAQPASCTIDIH